MCSWCFRSFLLKTGEMFSLPSSLTCADPEGGQWWGQKFKTYFYLKVVMKEKEITNGHRFPYM